MAKYKEAEQIRGIVKDAQKIVVIQPDNPDVDSLASALALESIFEEQGKNATLYCGVDMPSYLHYLPGWGRVVRDFPKDFDASVVVDTSSKDLLDQLNRSGALGWVASKPSVVIDHHATEPTIDFAKVICQPKAVATGEVIYELAQQLDWQLDDTARELVSVAILSDSLGLMSASTSARTIHIIGELVEAGVNLPELESARRETLKREPELIHYKGQLLERVEFHHQDKIALVTIPWKEIEKYSPLYNPSMLVLDDMRLGKGTLVAIAFKQYHDGKITAKIRCNYGWGVADKLAEHFGGGGHPLASGFKIAEKRDIEELKNEVIKVAADLLAKVEQEAEK
jgi:phosphoesterase RecJ-like protein